MRGEPSVLLERLEAIGRSLAATGRARALLGLGSVGLETERLDRYSDLDFFVLCEPGHKRGFVEDLGWLAAARPIAYAYRNTVDGWKALSDDGVLAEFAVFEPDELAAIPFAPGRLVWARPGFDPGSVAPRRLPDPTPPGREWLIGEAMTCLYTGLCRWHRGERLAAMRMVQVHALDKLLLLGEQLAPVPAGRDPFAIARRFEQRHPQAGWDVASMAQGYARTLESARAMLEWLAARVPLPPPLCREVEALLDGGPDQPLPLPGATD